MYKIKPNKRKEIIKNKFSATFFTAFIRVCKTSKLSSFNSVTIIDLYGFSWNLTFRYQGTDIVECWYIVVFPDLISLKGIKPSLLQSFCPVCTDRQFAFKDIVCGLTRSLGQPSAWFPSCKPKWREHMRLKWWGYIQEEKSLKSCYCESKSIAMTSIEM